MSTLVRLVGQHDDLKSVEKKIGITKVSYDPSPKNVNPTFSGLMEFGGNMLNAYKRHMQGDTSAPVKEISIG